jgi:hypothetical protein
MPEPNGWPDDQAPSHQPHKSFGKYRYLPLPATAAQTHAGTDPGAFAKSGRWVPIVVGVSVALVFLAILIPAVALVCARVWCGCP